MRSLRKAKVFISYSSRDQDIRDECVRLLKENRIEAVYDDRLRAGDELSTEIQHLIDTSDCVVCLGTRASFESSWCKKEVEHAVYRRRPYYPIVASEEASLGQESPDWFRGRITSAHPEIMYFRGMGEFAAKLAEVRDYGRLPLRWLVLGVFLLLLVGPLVLAALVRAQVLPLAGPETRASQQAIELINERIEQSRDAELGSADVLVEMDPDDRNTVLYRDAKTGTVIAKDLFVDSLLRERVFLDGEQVVARDVLSTQSGPDGGVALLKTREIYLVPGKATIIEDLYDSTGRLFSKRVRSADDLTGHRYGDVGRSVFPVLIPPYR